MNRFRRTDETTKDAHDQERLSAYLDGELSPQERDAVQLHLAECPDCQWDLASLRQSVQWTRELPTVPLPCSFTIPVKVERERAPRRRWTLLPVLQGASALIALLLFVAVAGDFWLNGFQFARAPMSQAVLETIPQVQATEVVEEATEAPAELKAMAPAAASPEAMITQEMAAAAEAAATALPAPGEQLMVAAAATEAAAATMAPAGMGVGGEAGARTAEAQADQATSTAAQPPSEMQPFTATVPAVPTATIAAPASGAPEAGAAASATAEAAAATVVAEAPALTQALPAEQVREGAAERYEPGFPLLRAVELGLAVALLLCIAAIFLLALQRRRAR